jgi:hypothetical protein
VRMRIYLGKSVQLQCAELRMPFFFLAGASMP